MGHELFLEIEILNFSDSHYFASTTPKMRDGGDSGRNFDDLIENSKSQISMRITNSTILSRSGPRMAEIQICDKIFEISAIGALIDSKLSNS